MPLQAPGWMLYVFYLILTTMGRRHFRDEEPQKLSNMLESPQLGRAEALPLKPHVSSAPRPRTQHQPEKSDSAESQPLSLNISHHTTLTQVDQTFVTPLDGTPTSLDCQILWLIALKLHNLPTSIQTL